MSKKETVDPEVGIILRLVRMVNEHHMFPHSGGLFDQNALFIDLYYYTNEVINTRKELDDRQEESKNRVANAQVRRRR